MGISVENFQPMKLFLSYGHPEAEICKRIVQALKTRGHSVWFDEKQIAHGSDWRERITKGIRDSNGVIACLSKHSVRDPGVCRDELSIAIGVLGGNIKTILLEPEQDTKPPASVCHIQWLDMSSWRTYYEQGEAEFQPWFDRKMSQLFEIIESKDSRDFVGQISAIREKLHINYNTSKQIYLLKRLFVGREWLKEQLEQWLDDPDGARLCLLYGDPGVGKSAFAAHYIHYNPRVAAGLFCEKGNPHYNNARTVIMTLAYLLACRLPSYRVVLADILEYEKRLSELESSELFDCLLATPLTALSIDGGHETLCIVIDGLDECSQGEQNALAETLARYVPRLPKWLRVLATAREVSAVKVPLQGAYHLELHGTQEENLKDIRFYFEQCLQEKYEHEPGWQNALTGLAERSGGIFLYARLVTEGIMSGKISIDDPSLFPDGLSDAFYQWFGWYFPDDREYKDHFRLPLGMLLTAPEPLPTDELKRIFDWDDNELEDFLRRIDVLLQRGVNIFRKETVTFSHLYIIQWLDSPYSGKYRSQRSAALGKMAKRFYTFFQQDAERLTDFEALHLSELLKQSDEIPAWIETMMNRDLFARIIHSGDFCHMWGALPEAMRCFLQAQEMAEKMTANRNKPEDLGNLTVADERVANILKAQGNLDAALALYQKGLSIREELIEKHDTLDDRFNLGVGYGKIADILISQENLTAAMTFCEKSIAIHKQVVQERGTPGDRQSLNVDYCRVADILRAQGDLDGAKDLYRKALVIWKQLVRERGTPEDQRNLCYCYSRIAEILKSQENLNGAMALYQKALAVREQLARKRGTPDDHRDLSISYDDVADILRAQGDLDGAKNLYKKALTILEQLVQEHATPRDRRSLSRCYNNVAYILQIQGIPDDAMPLYQKALSVSEQLIKECGTPKDNLTLRVIYENVADILQAQEDLDGAVTFYQKALGIREQLVKEQGTPENRMNLSVSYDNVADVLRAQENPDAAMALYQKALGIREQLVKEQGTPENRMNLSVSYDNVADVLQAQENPDAAMALYQKALGIREQLVKERGKPLDCMNLSVSYDNVAMILLIQGDLDNAKALYEKALKIREQLAKEQGTPENRWALSVSYDNVANILQAKGDPGGAKALREKARAIQTQLS